MHSIPRAREKLAFLLSGTFGFILYYCFSLGLVRVLSFEQEHAAFLAVLASVPPTFLLQKRVAFRHRGSTLPSFAKYCLLQGFNAVAIGFLARLGRELGMRPEVNFVVAGGLVVVVSYLALSRVVFLRDGGRQEHE